jgi:hypothetical protein
MGFGMVVPAELPMARIVVCLVTEGLSESYYNGNNLEVRTQAIRIMVQINHSRLAELCRKHDVRVLKIFGSAARGEDTPASDIDLLVEFEGSPHPSAATSSRPHRSIETATSLKARPRGVSS